MFNEEQSGDNFKNQFKALDELKKSLDDEISELKGKIDDVTAEAMFREDQVDKLKANMKFLDALIKEFRPRLAPKGGLQPLNEEAAEEHAAALRRQKTLMRINTDIFMTESSFPDQKKAGEIIDEDDSFDQYETKRFVMTTYIPISFADIHIFIKEKCTQNLFLINQINSIIEELEKYQSGNNE